MATIAMPIQREQVNDDERSAGEEGRQRVHDKHDLLLIQPLGQQTVMQVVFIR